MAEHVATCHCGQFKATCRVDPTYMAMCHCKHCQRRTGSAFNLGVWFNQDDVQFEGAEKIFKRTGDRNLEITFHFCPECGTTLWWTFPGFEGRVGIAGGCFADPDLMKPSRIVYCESKIKWVQNPEGVSAFETYPGP